MAHENRRAIVKGEWTLARDDEEKQFAEQRFGEWQEDRTEAEMFSKPVRITMPKEDWSVLELKAKAMGISVSEFASYAISKSSSLVPGQYFKRGQMFTTDEAGNEYFIDEEAGTAHATGMIVRKDGTRIDPDLELAKGQAEFWGDE